MILSYFPNVQVVLEASGLKASWKLLASQRFLKRMFVHILGGWTLRCSTINVS